MGCCFASSSSDDSRDEKLLSIDSVKKSRVSMDRFQQMNHLSLAKRSNWIHFKEYEEITTMRKGYCVLFPEYVHIYSHEVNQQVQPKDLLDIISLRGGIIEDHSNITRSITLNKKLTIEFGSLEEKKLWLHDLLEELDLLNIEDRVLIMPFCTVELEKSQLTSALYALQLQQQKHEAIQYLSHEILVTKHYLVHVIGATSVHRSHQRLLRLDHQPGSSPQHSLHSSSIFSVSSLFIIWHHPKHHHEEDDGKDSKKNNEFVDIHPPPGRFTHKTSLSHSETEKHILINSILEVNNGISDPKLLKKFGLDATLNSNCFSVMTRDGPRIHLGIRAKSRSFSTSGQGFTAQEQQHQSQSAGKCYDFQCESQGTRDAWVFHLRNLIQLARLFSTSCNSLSKD